MKLRVSSSVGQFKKKAEQAWNLKEWEGIYDKDPELLFFGLFHDRDFEVFHNFKGKKSVFWCGGDILRLTEDYERRRVLKLDPDTKHYCETEAQADLLREYGFEPEVIPSFLGAISKYDLSFQPPSDGKWKVWISGHPGREVEYGFSEARELARIFKDVEFHLYGVDDEFLKTSLEDNMVNHGWVTEEQLDKDIKGYHGAIRANTTDGVSEIVIKGILLGQFVMSRLPYEGVPQYQNFEQLVGLIHQMKRQLEPNVRTRAMWLKKLNQFPWCKKDFYEPDNKPTHYDVWKGK